MSGIDFEFLLRGEYHDWLVRGFVMSLALAGMTLVGAVPLAASVALARLSPVRLLRALATGYVEAIRNVPLLAHLLFWYFGAPELLPEPVRQRLYAGNVEIVSAVIGLTLYTAAYMAEDIRSGIRAVPSTQSDAAKALGFGYLQAMRIVVLPQALRITVPPLISQTLNLWKNTSIATVVGAGELMYQAARVESASFRSADTFMFATLAYLSVSLVITALAALYQHRYPPRTA